MYLVVNVSLHLLGRSNKVILVSSSLRCQVLLEHANSCKRLLQLHKKALHLNSCCLCFVKWRQWP